MAHLKHQAGRALDRAMAWMEWLAPSTAFKLKRHFFRPDMEFVLRRLRRDGFEPATVIDVGAYRGEWAALCRLVFPHSRILMIEPSPERVAFLRDRHRHEPGFSIVQALAGSRESTVLFREQDSNSGVVSQADAATIPMTETPLDALVADTAFATPQLMKIDVQGYDLEVLKGATATLTSVEILVVELSLIPLHPIAPSYRDAIDWLDDHGFRLLDIAAFIRRPVDSALWQIDGVFARKDSTLGAVARGW